MSRFLCLFCLLGAIGFLGLAARDTYTMATGEAHGGFYDSVWREGPEMLVKTTNSQRVFFGSLGLLFLAGTFYFANVTRKGRR